MCPRDKCARDIERMRKWREKRIKKGGTIIDTMDIPASIAKKAKALQDMVYSAPLPKLANLMSTKKAASAEFWALVFVLLSYEKEDIGSADALYVNLKQHHKTMQHALGKHDNDRFDKLESLRTLCLEECKMKLDHTSYARVQLALAQVEPDPAAESPVTALVAPPAPGAKRSAAENTVRGIMNKKTMQIQGWYVLVPLRDQVALSDDTYEKRMFLERLGNKYVFQRDYDKWVQCEAKLRLRGGPFAENERMGLAELDIAISMLVSMIGEVRVRQILKCVYNGESPPELLTEYMGYKLRTKDLDTYHDETLTKVGYFQLSYSGPKPDCSVQFKFSRHQLKLSLTGKLALNMAVLRSCVANGELPPSWILANFNSENQKKIEQAVHAIYTHGQHEMNLQICRHSTPRKRLKLANGILFRYDVMGAGREFFHWYFEDWQKLDAIALDTSPGRPTALAGLQLPAVREEQGTTYRLELLSMKLRLYMNNQDAQTQATLWNIIRRTNCQYILDKCFICANELSETDLSALERVIELLNDRQARSETALVTV